MQSYKKRYMNLPLHLSGACSPGVEPGMGGFRTQVDIIMNVHKSVRKVPVILVKFECKLNFLDIYSKSPQISIFIKSFQ